MLTSSFALSTGHWTVAEGRRWQEGLFDWRSFLDRTSLTGLSEHRKLWYDGELREAESLTETEHLLMYGSHLPRRQHWRLCGTCRSGLDYLGIDTPGASHKWGEETVMGLHREETTTSLTRFEPSSWSTTLQPVYPQ